ncbi:hypothetical protein [Geobacter sp. AOG1]|uniref:hypothetical protein n=1 Tax=Geobacter sp. AOG1 TaxID=1566346 RepID=UPI001CC77FB1|nr:hypothetical protein [Geobacter sp. AOG1]GFE56610.1 hypothetical protein AOG1_04890 [Geobacter sp. AOG1]
MKARSLRSLCIFIFSLMLASIPIMAWADAGQTKATPPPVTQPLTSEGILAVNLVAALGVSSTNDVIEAETALGDIGITPRNGWIADYPVTPDIVTEVRQSIATAAESKTLSYSREDALKRFDETITGIGLMVRPYSGESAMDNPVNCETYPNPATIITTYNAEGPPIVTYYCPPADYYALYAWVPYPFWWSDFWFPGFFILRDFHRHVFIHNHFVLFSNHFNDIRRHHVFRIDAVDRFRGRTFAGIGVKNSRNFISTGVPRSERTIFNPPRGMIIRSGPATRGPMPMSAPTMRGGGGSRR